MIYFEVVLLTAVMLVVSSIMVDEGRKTVGDPAGSYFPALLFVFGVLVMIFILKIIEIASR